MTLFELLENSTDILRCPECHGDGEVIAAFLMTAEGCRHITVKCETCNGAGQASGKQTIEQHVRQAIKRAQMQVSAEEIENREQLSNRIDEKSNTS